MKARKHCYSTGTVSQESLLSVFLSTPHYKQTMNSFIPTMGRLSSSYVCVRKIISRRKWHQRTLCCELTILHLAASVCSYFIIWSPFKVWCRKAQCSIRNSMLLSSCSVWTRRHYTAEKSMRLAELVLFSHVFIFVGVTPPLLPFICKRKPD